MAYLLIAMWGCGPPPIERWQGCLAESAGLASDPRFGVKPAGGRGTLLGVGVHWGEVPWLTDHGRTADLWVVLPGPAEVGHHDLADVERWYAERGWGTRELEGTLDVVELTPSEAVVRLDLVVEPGGRALALSGRTRVGRGRGAEGCRPR